MKTVDEVRSFWERNPLFSGESRHEIDSDAYYQEHRRIAIQDGFAGRLDPRLLPPEHNRDNVLDIGCGPGMWLAELQLQCGIDKMSGVDLTSTAIKLSENRLRLYGLQANLFVQNVEALAFADNSFSHVNCLRVIHHTPNAEKAISEISRIVRPRGSATISVYYTQLTPEPENPCGSGVEERRGGLGPMGITPFPLPAHQTGRADFPHPASRPASPQSTRRGAKMDPT